MAPLDPNRTKPFEGGFESSLTRDTKTSGLALNPRSYRHSNRDSVRDAKGDHARAIHINQNVFEDEDELTLIPTQPCAPNGQASGPLPLGHDNNVGLVERLRGSIQRLNPFSQDTIEGSAAYTHTAGSVGHQPLTISAFLSHDNAKGNHKHSPIADIDRLRALHRSQISDISAQLADKEARYQSETARLEAGNAELSHRLTETEHRLQGCTADMESQKARATAEWDQKEARYRDTISKLEADRAKMATELRERDYRAQAMVSSLEAENLKHARKAAALQMQFDAACADFSKELDEAKSKNSFKQVKATDTEVQGSWKDLSFSVRQFVKEHCPPSFSPSMLQERLMVDRVSDLKLFCLNPTLYCVRNPSMPVIYSSP
ncbi:hypothetical protein QBC45DRAFT_466959 [Copromyces sp. CBS 386.78]|nr:hypothetical protein QBC45DRAFT_466959 [Copromyces sp. CBS 386.78]